MPTTRALSPSSALQKRFAVYVERLACVLGHADRNEPLKDYCTGLLLDGERKSVEPMAARLHPDEVSRAHQSLHHLVAKAPWDDETLLSEVRSAVLPALTRKSPVVAWIVDDTGIPKKGWHSVGVSRQYCGQVGKQDNCQVAVSLSVATQKASLPVAFQLYLPESWAGDKERRRKAGVPEEVVFETKPRIAMAQIRRAVDADLPRGVVLADAAYGNETRFREELDELGLAYMVGIQSSLHLWPTGMEPLPAKEWKGTGRKPTLRRRSKDMQPSTAQQLVLVEGETRFEVLRWREGSNRALESRFLALRVRPAHRDYWRSEPYPECWLVAEWPEGEAQPTKYWLSNLGADMALKDLVQHAKRRWMIERDYEELKQELGLGHYEGRGWRGFHHHAALVIAAYGFLVKERSLFSPSARGGTIKIDAPGQPQDYRPRGAAS